MDKSTKISLGLAGILFVLALGQNMTGMGGYWTGYALQTFALVALFIFLIELGVKHLEWSLKMLAVVLAGALFVGLTFPRAELGVAAYGVNEDFSGITNESIRWQPEFVRITVDIVNDSNESDTDVDATMEFPGGVIAGIEQSGNVAGVTWKTAFDSPLRNMFLVTKSPNGGPDQLIPMTATGEQTGPVWRIHCDRILRHSIVKLVVAFAVQNPIGTSNKIYRERTLPTRFVFAGTYTQGKVPFSINESKVFIKN